MFSFAFILEIFLLALALAMDCFTVSITCGLQRTLTLKRALLMAALFGFFQGFMPFLGTFFGQVFARMVQSAAAYIAFTLLVIIGIKMIIEGRSFRLRNKVFDVGSTKVLLMLSIATSIDAFVVGIGFAMDYTLVGQLAAVIMITVVTFLMSLIGWKMGEKVNFIKPRFALVLGGVILILIGSKTLIVHLVSIS